MEDAPPQKQEKSALKKKNKGGKAGAEKAKVKKSERAAKISQVKKVAFNKDIDVDFSEPLDDLNKGTIKAYRAQGSNKMPSSLMAFICDKSLTPRRQATIKYSKIFNVSLPRFVESGKIFVPHEKEERFCFLYENTFGQKLLSPQHPQAALAFRPDDVMANIVKPLIKTIIELNNKDMVHGEIWPGNMFHSGIGAGEGIKLGDCLAAPASSMLPALYEPVERAMADPVAKGRGSLADDLYSFGVSLAVMMRTSDPLAGLSEAEVIERKIDKGSYTTLIGRDRFSGAMLELLRGLLYDDASQRWDLDDIEAWLDGRRLSPKQSSKRIKAARPIIFANKKFTRPELLATELHKQPEETARFVENGELHQWVDRAIEDKGIKVRLEQVEKDLALLDRGEGYNQRLAAFLAVGLYTDSPIFYDEIRFLPSGFGKALTTAFRRGENIQPYANAMRHVFVIPALRYKKTGNLTPILTKFDSCRAFMQQTNIGFGIERCMYVMDVDCPCLSPVLDKYYVSSPEELMRALEKVCAEDKPQSLIDRHILAFLSVKDRKNVEPHVAELRSKESYKNILGQLQTFATIQIRARLENFPAIAHWFADNLDVVFDRFHDSKRKEFLQDKVEKIKKTGDLNRLSQLFDDPLLYQSDVGNFQQAAEQFKKLDREKEKIESKLKDKNGYGQELGQQTGSVVAMFVSFVIILITAYVTLVKG